MIKQQRLLRGKRALLLQLFRFSIIQHQIQQCYLHIKLYKYQPVVRHLPTGSHSDPYVDLTL